jgi:hypothetical protein
VQEEPIIPEEELAVPLPTEYWVRPIEGQNTEWYRVSSNWYNNARDRDNGGPRNAWQQDGVGPNSAHILWTKPTEDGGVVGGGNFSVRGEVYSAGHQYQTRFDANGIILMGKYFYRGPRYWGGEGDIYRAVDLRTGETIWEADLGSDSPTFGYLYDYDDMNQHGIQNPGWLFSNNFDDAIHPLYGEVAGLNLESVPSFGTWQVAGPKGEVIRYQLSGFSGGYLRQWNSSKVFTSSSSSTYDAGTDNRFDWRVDAPWRVGMSQATIRGAVFNDYLLGSNGSHAVGTNAVTYHVPDEFTMWAVSLKPGDEGRLLWMKNFQTAGFPDNHVLQFRKSGEGMFTMIELPYQTTVGYDAHTGELVWRADTAIADFNPFGYYGYASLINQYYDKIAYGKVFVSGYSGMVHCYDLYNGTLLWTYTAPTGRTVFKYYSLFMGVIADEKLYIGTHEHSADTPLFKGNKVRALDINTGEEVFTLYGWAYPGTMSVADGTLIYWNNYDHQIYAIAQGPTATTVAASPKISVHGNSVLVEGTVVDVSAGTEQEEQARRFPAGVPAVSEESMSAWMEYVYMQKPRPSDTVGVDVTITVLDPNNNVYDVGTATSDASGFFSLGFVPEVPGKYTVIATFPGSAGYYGSFSETAIIVEEAPLPPAPEEPMVLPPTETYITAATIAIIIAIAIVGLLLFRKR